jgi:hypothetical protein
MYRAVPDLGGAWQNRRLIRLALLSYLTVNIIRKHPVAISNNNGNAGYSNLIPNTGHTYGTITDGRHKDGQTFEHSGKIPYL